MSYRSFVAVLLVLASSTPAVSAQTVVAGRVIDRTKHVVLEKVAVELLSATDSVLGTGQTASDGTFTLMAPRGGTYRVRLTPPHADPHLSDTLVVAEGEYVAREFAIEIVPGAFPVDKVHKPVVPARGSPQPRYPPDLRQAGIGGCVTVSFVVDTTGHAERSSLKLLAYSDRAFVQAVWDVLPRMQFVPAEIGGRKVRQIVEQPFTWAIVGDYPMECKPAAPKP